MISNEIEVVTAHLLYKIIDKIRHSSAPKQRMDFIAIE